MVPKQGKSDKLLPNQRLLQENDDVNYGETMERKLLYVGMTRATERLYMSCHGEPGTVPCIVVNWYVSRVFFRHLEKHSFLFGRIKHRLDTVG